MGGLGRDTTVCVAVVVPALVYWCTSGQSWIPGFLAAEPWGSQGYASALMCGEMSWALWWTGLCPGVAVGSGGLKTAHVLVGVAVSLPS